MPTLILSAEQAQQLLYVLANAEGPGIKWGVVNPLVMTIGQQLQQQAQGNNAHGDLDQNGGAVGEAAGGQAATPEDIGLKRAASRARN